jgi:hypothetical protein
VRRGLGCVGAPAKCRPAPRDTLTHRHALASRAPTASPAPRSPRGSQNVREERRRTGGGPAGGSTGGVAVGGNGSWHGFRKRIEITSEAYEQRVCGCDPRTTNSSQSIRKIRMLSRDHSTMFTLNQRNPTIVAGTGAGKGSSHALQPENTSSSPPSPLSSLLILDNNYYHSTRLCTHAEADRARASWFRWGAPRLVAYRRA